MSRRARPAEAVCDVLAAADPVSAFFGAHDRRALVALRTSGTSAAPRWLLRTTTSWVSSFPHVTSLLAIGPGSRVWVPGPVASTMNLFALVHARSVGARVVTEPDEATHAHLTPSALTRTLDDGTDLGGVHVVAAGDRLRPSLHDRATAAGIRVSHYYGAAELSFVAWGTHEQNLRPFPEVEVAARTGVLWVRSPFLCAGYDGFPGALHRAPDGFATVGDYGWFANGHLVVTGRGTESVNTGGVIVRVADVEHVLRPVVEGEVLVLGVPHRGLGQVVAAVLSNASSLPRARALARSSLAPTQRPRLWFQIAEPPLTEAGKVDRVALTRLVASGRGVRRLT